MTQRVSQLQSFLSDLGVGGIFVSNPVNIRYLTGYPAEDAWLVVTPRQVFYITDFRYMAQVSGAFKVSGITIVQFDRSVFETAVECAVTSGIKVLGVEENHLTLYQFNRFKALGRRRLKLKALSGTVEALRVVKGVDEIAAIRAAIEVNLKGFRYIKKYVRAGITERQIYHKLQDFTRQEAVDFAFPPIIASGLNAAYPHARVSDRKLRAGEPLLLDFGVEKGGYKSDLTRMFFLGKMPPSFAKNLSLIRGAQEKAFAQIRSGVEARVVDAAARDFLKKNGVDRYFGHSLGHGVGIETHEMPRLSTKSREVLLENMVVTVEPGIYFDGKYGVRLEEMVLVTKNGCEVISGHRDH
jgi:Xaa-Pro aminopeptidase